MNPSAPHGFGDAVLVAFLKRLLGEGISPSKLAHILINGVGSVAIHREWHNIDILIALNDPKLKLLIVVELKLHSRESKDQLERYKNFVEGLDEYKEYEMQYIYMTPQGTESSHEAWRDFNMTDEFINDLKQLTKNDIGNKTARAMLADYVRLMEQKFMEEKELNDLAKKLWAKYPAALNFLSDNKPDLVSNLFDSLDAWRNWDFTSKRYKRCTLKEWDAVEGMRTGSGNHNRLVYFELDRPTAGIQARFVIGPGDQQSRRNILQALLDSGVDVGTQRSVDTMSPMFTRLRNVWLYEEGQWDIHQSDVDIADLTEDITLKLENFFKSERQKIDFGLSKLKAPITSN